MMFPREKRKKKKEMLEVTGKEEAKLGKWKSAAFYYFIFFILQF